MTVALEPGRAYLLAILRDARCRTAAAAPQVAAWLHWCKGTCDLSDTTLLAYEKRVSPLLVMFPDTPLEEFTHVEIDALMSATPSLSKRSVRTALTSLFRTWGSDEDVNLVSKDPTRMLKRMRAPKQQYVETFTEAEVEALTGAEGEEGLLLMLMFDTGLRISELCKLRVRDVQLARGQIVVLSGKGDKDRVVPLTSRLLAAFSDWTLLDAPKPNEYVFPHRKPGTANAIDHRDKPIVSDTLRAWFYKKLLEAGVRKLRPHATRHTFATTLMRRGAPVPHVSKLLGHKSIQTTVDIYAHLVVEDLRGVMELLEA